jgi:hypothetical protein
MRGGIRPLTNTPSCRGAYLKHRDSFTFYVDAAVSQVCVTGCSIEISFAFLFAVDTEQLEYEKRLKSVSYAGDMF